ncbi:MAG TPA: transcriptional repressor [Accumulibacter sp.]|nr:transcriptional repressor [Accumulibacter sp.]
MSVAPATPVDLLRAAGVRKTPGRVRVLEALAAAAAPLSHAELEALLPDADRVTIYRVLDALVGCGLALKAVDTRGVFRFSATGAHRQHANHVHFRCTACGGVFCLKAPPPLPPKLPRGFRLDEVEYDVRGTCAQCVHKAT